MNVHVQADNRLKITAHSNEVVIDLVDDFILRIIPEYPSNNLKSDQH